MCYNKRKFIDDHAVFYKGASISFLKLYVAYPALRISQILHTALLDSEVGVG